MILKPGAQAYVRVEYFVKAARMQEKFALGWFFGGGYRDITDEEKAGK